MCPRSSPATRCLPHIVTPGTPRPRCREHFSKLATRPPARGQRGHRHSNPRPNDHAARATLGRRRRPRRPELMDGPADVDRDRCACLRFPDSFPTRFSRCGCPRVPPQTMFGPETRSLPVGKWIPESFETARPFKAVDSFSPIPRSRTATVSERLRRLVPRASSTQNRSRLPGKPSPPGCAGSVFVPERPPGTAARPAQMGTGHSAAKALRESLLVGMRPPFAQSAWSPPSPSPPNDHADCATLGRRRRPRRPGMRNGSPIQRGLLRARRPHHNGQRDTDEDPFGAVGRGSHPLHCSASTLRRHRGVVGQTMQQMAPRS